MSPSSDYSPKYTSSCAMKSLDEACPLRNISEMIQADESFEPRKHSLKSPRLDRSRLCFGLALGVLVPLVLAALVVLRSATALPPSSAAEKSKGHGVPFGSSAEEYIDPSNATMDQTTKTRIPSLLANADGNLTFAMISEVSDAHVNRIYPSKNSGSTDSHSGPHGRPALRGADSSILHVSIPLYFYGAYALSATTGIAWVVLIVHECRHRVV